MAWTRRRTLISLIKCTISTIWQWRPIASMLLPHAIYTQSRWQVYAQFHCFCRPSTLSYPADRQLFYFPGLVNWSVLENKKLTFSCIMYAACLCAAPRCSAPLRAAAPRFAPRRSALLRTAPRCCASLRSAPRRSALLRAAALRSAPLRAAPHRSALLRFAPRRSAVLRTAQRCCASLRVAPRCSAPLRSAPLLCSAPHRSHRSALLRLAPHPSLRFALQDCPFAVPSREKSRTTMLKEWKRGLDVFRP